MGTATIANRATTFSELTGTVPASGADAISITGTKNGQPFTIVLSYLKSGGAVTLAAQYPGDSGAVSWMAILSSEAGGSTQTSYAHLSQLGNDQATLQYNYNCMWNSSNSVTLDHPWTESGCAMCGTDYYGYNWGRVTGWGQLPCMLGIKSYGMGVLARSGVPNYAAAYQTLLNGATRWIHDSGVDPITYTVPYGANYQYCATSMSAVPNTVTLFDWKTPGCTAGASLYGVSGGREQGAELGNAISDYYLASPTADAKDWGGSRLRGRVVAASSITPAGFSPTATAARKTMPPVI
jgi:hypothetical protein